MLEDGATGVSLVLGSSLAYAKLRQIIKDASSRARVPNPCEAVRGPKPNRSRDNFLRAAEVPKVLAWIQAKRPHWYPHVLVSLTTGLRWSEVSALVWTDLDEAGGVIRVVQGGTEGGGLMLLADSPADTRASATAPA